MVIEALFQMIIEQYALPLDGVHGISHWARVLENGCRVAEASQANVKVVQLFALFHDSKRTNESEDPDHGRRGAEYARSLQESSLLGLSEKEFDLLYTACSYHTDGLTEADVTIQACWDADRLDLNRVGILPDPVKLCTNAAKSADMLNWANERAAHRVMPEAVRLAWNMNV